MNPPRLRPLRDRAVFITVLGATSLLFTAGCATAPNGPASTAERTDRSDAAWRWHDPEFYTPAHDRRAIVLPPPPFTGFSADGKVTPLLPNQPRPRDVSASAVTPAPTP